MSSTIFIKEYKNSKKTGDTCWYGARIQFLLSAGIHLLCKSAVIHANAYKMVMPAAQDAYGKAISYLYGHYSWAHQIPSQAKCNRTISRAQKTTAPCASFSFQSG